MASETVSRLTWVRIIGWVLVAVGVLAVILSTIQYYSPSMTDEDIKRQNIMSAAFAIAGIAWIVLGWLMLRRKKGV
jgi:uncharacterized membrane protein